MRTAYLNTLYDLAMNDRRVYAMISDNGAIVYDRYRRDLPDQYLNLGISEANMLGMAAGMASRGKIPFAYTIGAFLAYRANEFIRNDVCLQNQNVKIVGTAAGEAYPALGPTHHATEDLGCIRSFPNLTIITPCGPMEVAKATRAAYQLEGPVYLRIGTNREPEIYDGDYDFQIGRGVELRPGNDVAVISMGSILKDVIDVADGLKASGVHIRVINIHTIKPIDREIIIKAIDEVGKVITVEDHNIIGGLGSAVSEVIAEHGAPVRFRRIGLQNFSQGYGTYAEVKEMNGVGKSQIKKAIEEML